MRARPNPPHLRCVCESMEPSRPHHDAHRPQRETAVRLRSRSAGGLGRVGTTMVLLLLHLSYCCEALLMNQRSLLSLCQGVGSPPRAASGVRTASSEVSRKSSGGAVGLAYVFPRVYSAVELHRGPYSHTWHPSAVVQLLYSSSRTTVPLHMYT